MCKIFGILVITFSLFFLTCEIALPDTTKEEPTLKQSQSASQDEKEIRNLVQEFQNAYRQHNSQKILALYADDAMIQISTSKRDYVGVILPKKEHAKYLSRQMYFLERFGMKLDIAPPEALEIKGNKCFWSGRYKLYSTDSRRPLTEKGNIKFEFEKTNSGWLISKRTWKITDCNYPGFKK